MPVLFAQLFLEGVSRLRAVEADVLRERLAEVISPAREYSVVHSCSAAVPFGIIRAAGADAISFDLSQHGGAKRTRWPSPPRPTWGC